MVKSVREAPRRTPEERAAAGKATRAEVPRSSHAVWDPPADRADPVAVLQDQARSRVPELIPIRHGRMLASEFAFFRGGAAVMAADLATTPSSGFRVQLCGDAHLSNFGGFASPDRDMIFSVNDFDETLPGPWEWDVKRLAASFAIAGRERGFSPKERRAIVLASMSRYREAMREFAGMRNLDVWYARLDAAGVLERWRKDVTAKAVRTFEQNVAKARGKDSLRALAKLCHDVNGGPRIISDPPLIVPLDELLSGADHARLDAAVRRILQDYQRSVPRDRRHLLDGYEVVDVARKVVGVGSVGTRAWIALMLGRDHGDPLFLQVKEAQESVLAPYAGASRYRNQGQRVVEGQRLMQTASDILLGWYRTEGVDGKQRDFYVRQLWDWKLSADVEHMAPPTMRIYGEACGWTLARAHARSGDRIAIAAYLGSGRQFETAIAEFAEAYADQNERDYRIFAASVDDGVLTAEQGL
ncbi:MAG TPA: DUF2252 domain-containing protein [Actinomycetes bacterium]